MAKIPGQGYWWQKWSNPETPLAEKNRLDQIYGFSKKATTTPTQPATPTPPPGVQQGSLTTNPMGNNAGTTSTPTPTTTVDYAERPYTVPGYGINTTAITDAAGDTWYKTQGGNWRNQRTQAVSNTMPGQQSVTPGASGTTATTATAATTSTGAPLYDYVVPGTGIKTQAIKDVNGVVHYKTQGGNWRNTQTNAVSPTMPQWQQQTTTPTTTAPTIPQESGTYQLQNPDWFNAAQGEAQRHNDQISPADWLANGEDIHYYGQLYKENSYWNPDGTVTELGKAAGKSDVKLPSANTNPINYNALFPEFEAWQSGDYAASPLYKLQVEEGTKALEALMAARGLHGSGAEIEGTAKLLQQIGAYEAARQQESYQTNADRLLNLMTEESQKAERGESNQFNQVLQLAQTFLNALPTAAGGGAATSSANIASSSAATIGNILSQLATIAGAGAGTGTSTTNPSSYLPIYSATMDAANTADIGTLLSNIFGSLYS